MQECLGERAVALNKMMPFEPSGCLILRFAACDKHPIQTELEEQILTHVLSASYGSPVPSLFDPRIAGPLLRRNMGAVRCRERLGGLLKYYEREAA
jgi:hypothetical protein